MLELVINDWKAMHENKYYDNNNHYKIKNNSIHNKNYLTKKMMYNIKNKN